MGQHQQGQPVGNDAAVALMSSPGPSPSASEREPASPSPPPQPFPAGIEGGAAATPVKKEEGAEEEEEEEDTLEAYRAALPPPPRSPSSPSVLHLTLAVQHRAGQLAETLQWRGEVEGPLQDEEDTAKVQQAAGELAVSLLRLAEFLHMDLGRAMVEKIALNARKYPAELARARAGKYTAYSGHTGITKTEGQTTETGGCARRPPWSTVVSVKGLQSRLQAFAAERCWEQYHTPRNILLALLGEVGELAETVLELPAAVVAASPSRWDPKRRDSLAQELADVTIYLLRFSVRVGSGLLGEGGREEGRGC